MMLQETKSQFPKRSLKRVEEAFSVVHLSAKLQNFFLALVSSCCNIAKLNHISTALRQTAVFCACVRCLRIFTHIRHLLCRNSIDAKQAKAA